MRAKHVVHKTNNMSLHFGWTHGVSPFKAMTIMAKLLFFHSYECQGIQTKNPFDETLSLSFDLRLLKVNTDGIRQ